MRCAGGFFDCIELIQGAETAEIWHCQEELKGFLPESVRGFDGKRGTALLKLTEVSQFSLVPSVTDKKILNLRNERKDWFDFHAWY